MKKNWYRQPIAYGAGVVVARKLAAAEWCDDDDDPLYLARVEFFAPVQSTLFDANGRRSEDEDDIEWNFKGFVIGETGIEDCDDPFMDSFMRYVDLDDEDDIALARKEAIEARDRRRAERKKQSVS